MYYRTVTIMTKLFWRCNGGHYISTKRCPWDGWGSSEIEELCSAADLLTKSGKVPSIAELRNLKVSDRALQRTIVVEFGDEHAVFEALSPNEYILKGVLTPLRKLPRELL